MPTTRFAPSPTGYMHLGHAYSALFAAREAGDGTFLLRMEDIDPVRCKPEFAQALKEDLTWLGLHWPEPVRVQSEHLDDYRKALDVLRAQDLIYPCFCTRKEIEKEIAHAEGAPHAADGTPAYPGTCRALTSDERQKRLDADKDVCWRLDVAKASKRVGPLFWHDKRRGRIEAKPDIFGDVVLARKDVPTSYHLSVTVDDHLQGVDLVTRGEDLFASTHVHRLLQALLGYDVPEYDHHPLLTDETGRRYAKRDRSVTLRALREQGVSPEAIILRTIGDKSGIS